MGELPEQLDSNLNILDRLQEQRSQLEERLSSARYRMTLLRNQGPGTPMQGGTGGQNAGTSETSNLDQLKDHLTLLQAKYTEQHPDVVKTKKLIADIENTLRAQAGSSQETRHQENEGQPQQNVYSSSRQYQEIDLEIRSVSAEIAMSPTKSIFTSNGWRQRQKENRN